MWVMAVLAVLKTVVLNAALKNAVRECRILTGTPSSRHA